jgi:hypothetical protein
VRKTICLSKDVEFPLEFVTSKCAILSMQGRGKTHVAKVLAEEMLDAGQQVVVGDPTGVWWGLTSNASGRGDGFPVLVLGGDHGEVPLSSSAGAATADVVVGKRLSVVLDMSSFESDAEKVRFMTAFCDRLYRKNRRPLHLFLDEADEFIPQNPNADETRMLHVVKRIWQRGRVKGIGGTIISQRSAVVHKTVLSQSSTLIALQTMGPQDRKALISWFDSGWGTETQVEAFKEGIASLPKYQAWIFSPEFNIYARTKARPLKTFDSSATPDIVHGSIREPEKRAAIGLDKLNKIMAEAVEQAEANDIERVREALRKRDAEAKLLAKDLERVRARSAPKPLPVLPSIDPFVIKGLAAKLSATGEQLSYNASTAIANLRELIAESNRKFNEEIARVQEATKLVRRAQSAPVSDRDGGEDDAEHDYIEASIEDRRVAGPYAKDATVPARPHRIAQEGSFGVTPAGGERRMLVALAQHGTLGYSRWRMLAGIPKESSARTYVSRFRQRGWISELGGDFALTDDGQRAVGHYEPLPKGAALAQWWQGQFTGGEAKVLAKLLERPRVAWHPDMLHSHTDPSMTSSSFRTYISRLTVAGVIEKDREGRIQLDSGLREAVA